MLDDKRCETLRGKTIVKDRIKKPGAEDSNNGALQLKGYLQVRCITCPRTKVQSDGRRASWAVGQSSGLGNHMLQDAVAEETFDVIRLPSDLYRH